MKSSKYGLSCGAVLTATEEDKYFIYLHRTHRTHRTETSSAILDRAHLVGIISHCDGSRRDPKIDPFARIRTIAGTIHSPHTWIYERPPLKLRPTKYRGMHTSIVNEMEGERSIWVASDDGKGRSDWRMEAW